MAKRHRKQQREHWSPSSLDMLFTCPESFRRRYIEGDKIPPGIAMIRGTAVHGAANVNFSQKIETHEDLSVSDIKDAAAAGFEAELAGGYLLTSDEEGQGAKNVLGAAKDQAVMMAECHAVQQAPQYQPAMVEQGFNIALPGDRDLLGYIDMADVDGVVVDLKTASKKKSQADADNSLQLTAYAAGYRALTGEPPSDLRLETIIQTKKACVRDVVSTDRTDADFEALAERINAAEQLLQAGVFLPAPVGSWKCSPRWCGYFSTCRFVNRERLSAASEA